MDNPEPYAPAMVTELKQKQFPHFLTTVCGGVWPKQLRSKVREKHLFENGVFDGELNKSLTDVKMLWEGL